MACAYVDCSGSLEYADGRAEAAQAAGCGRKKSVSRYVCYKPVVRRVDDVPTQTSAADKPPNNGDVILCTC